jgi:hypothetical protein
MREIRLSGSEGGGAASSSPPYPYQGRAGVAWPAVNRWTTSKRGIIGGKSQLRAERPANERFE